MSWTGVAGAPFRQAHSAPASRPPATVTSWKPARSPVLNRMLCPGRLGPQEQGAREPWAETRTTPTWASGVLRTRPVGAEPELGGLAQSSSSPGHRSFHSSCLLPSQPPAGKGRWPSSGSPDSPSISPHRPGQQPLNTAVPSGQRSDLNALGPSVPCTDWHWAAPGSQTGSLQPQLQWGESGRPHGPPRACLAGLSSALAWLHTRPAAARVQQLPTCLGLLQRARKTVSCCSGRGAWAPVQGSKPHEGRALISAAFFLHQQKLDHAVSSLEPTTPSTAMPRCGGLFPSSLISDPLDYRDWGARFRALSSVGAAWGWQGGAGSSLT